MKIHRPIAAVGSLVAAIAVLAACTTSSGTADNGSTEDGSAAGETVNLQLAELKRENEFLGKVSAFFAAKQQ